MEGSSIHIVIRKYRSMTRKRKRKRLLLRYAEGMGRTAQNNQHNRDHGASRRADDSTSPSHPFIKIGDHAHRWEIRTHGCEERER